MIKRLIYLHILFVVSLSIENSVFAQQAKFSIEASLAVTVKPNEKNILEIPVRILRLIDEDSCHSFNILVKCEGKKQDNKYFTLYTPIIEVTREQMAANDTIFVLIRGEVSFADSDSALDAQFNKLLLISVSSPDTNVKAGNETCIIKLSPNTRQAKESDYVSFSLGANLDFADGVLANTFYGRLSFFDPRIINLRNWVDPTNLDRVKRYKTKDNTNVLNTKVLNPISFRYCGLYGSVYQNRYLTLDSNSVVTEYQKILHVSDTGYLQYSQQFSTRKTRITSTNYGFNISIPFTIAKPGTDDGIRSYLMFTPIDFEAVIRKYVINYTYDTIATYVKTVHRDSLNITNPVIESESKQFFDKYWGALTFSYNYSGKYYGVFIKTTPVGLYWKDDNRASYLYYGFYFGVKEKFLGLRVGGEIKGLYGKKNPFVNLFITKAFDLSKLGQGLLAN